MSGGEYLNLVILALFIAGATGYAFWLSRRANGIVVQSAQSKGEEAQIAPGLADAPKGRVRYRLKKQPMAGGGALGFSTHTYEVGKDGDFSVVKPRRYMSKKTPHSA